MSDSPIARTTVTNVAPGTTDGQTLIWDGGVPQWQPTDALTVDEFGAVTVEANAVDLITLTGLGSDTALISFAGNTTVTAPQVGALGDSLIFRAGANERMRVTSTGLVGVGVSAPNRKLHVKNDFVSLANFECSNGAASQIDFTSTTTGLAKAYVGTAGAESLVLGAGGDEAMRIDSAGNVLVGKTASNLSIVGVELTQTGVVRANANSLPSLILRRGASDGDAAEFFRSGTSVGSISVTAAATAYNTSSDYRLKENDVPVQQAIERVARLRPRQFNFKTDPANTIDGFMAHEAQEVVPNAVSGEKDGEEMQGIDHSKLVPLLTAAIQELTARLEVLENG